jgi:hypothetical protein
MLQDTREKDWEDGPRRGFHRHLLAYLFVTGMLAVVNAATSPRVLWFLLPLLGWGFAVAAHAYVVWSGRPPHRRMRTS